MVTFADLPRPSAPVTFRPGRKANDPSKPRLNVGRHLSGTGFPAVCDHYTGVADWGMLGNDDWGDCTCAGDGHIVEQQTALGQGQEYVVTTGQAIAAYEAVGKFDPNAGPPGQNPTDNGATVQDALAYLKRTGIGGHFIAAFGELDVRNLSKIKQAVWEFGCLSIGIKLPSSAMDQFNAGQPWTVVQGSGIDGGHCVIVVGYDANWIYVVTWGTVQKMSYAFWAQYVEEAWVPISHDWVSKATAKTPDGVDAYELGQEYAALTGQINPFPAPLPEPPPAPVPNPTPGPVPVPPIPGPKPSWWDDFLAWLEGLFGGHSQA